MKISAGIVHRAATRLLIVSIVFASLALACERSEEVAGPGTDSDPQRETVPQQRTEQPSQQAMPGRSGTVLAAAGSLDAPVGMPREKWRAAFAAPATTSPAVSGDTVTIALADYSVRALSANTGEELWIHESTQLVTAMAPAGDADAFVLSGERQTLLLRGEDGEVLWSDGPAGAPAGRIRATARAVYVPTLEGRLEALNPQSGEELWACDPDPNSGSMVTGHIAALDGVLYASLTNGTVSAIRASDGELLWRERLDGGLIAGPSVGVRGLHVGSAEGVIFHLNREDGSSREMESEVPLAVVTTTPVDTGSGLFVFDAAGSVSVAREPGTSDSRALRVGSLDSYLAGQPGLLDSLVVAADAAGSLSAINPESGRTAWSYPLGIRLYGEMSFAAGSLYVCGSDGTILSLVLDVDRDTVPLLTAARPVAIPESGEFRMEQRFVDLTYVPDLDAVYEWSIESSDPADELILALMRENGDVLATNMGKVTLSNSARAPLDAGVSYLIRVERAYPDETIVVTLSSELIE